MKQSTHRLTVATRGKGFYDSILAKARPDAVKLGVCFVHQIVDQVVMEEHDIRMNGVFSG